MEPLCELKGKVNDMKKLSKYFCMLFVGSILPFVIVESYFQDYVMIGYLALLTSAVCIVCFIIETLKGKVGQWLDARRQGLEDVSWRHDQPETTSLYYFRNYW